MLSFCENGLLIQGWRPKRTIVLLSWGAEEPKYMGSVEWIEVGVVNLRAIHPSYKIMPYYDDSLSLIFCRLFFRNGDIPSIQKGYYLDIFFQDFLLAAVYITSMVNFDVS